MEEKTLDISRIDKNLRIEETVNEPDIRFYDARTADVDFYGLYNPLTEHPMRRMPADVAERVSESVANLAKKTAGGRIRLKTDSEYLAIRVTRPARKTFMAHMTYAGCSGFDCYGHEASGYRYLGSFIPAVKSVPGFESVCHFGTREMREITLNFPLYDLVDDLYIGVQADACLCRGDKYAYPEPVVFYGSSITQGGCASRPGTSYQAMISRMLNCDYVNLGFSGSAKGEAEMSAYLATLPMSVFFMDYDHNSPEAALQQTHWDMYEAVRCTHPKTPIIMVTQTDCSQKRSKQESVIRRRQMIRENYERARIAGDAHVAFLDGQTIFPPFGGADCTVDGTHPNDLGFYAMAQAFAPLAKKALDGEI